MDLAVADLHELIGLALDRGGHLLTAGERCIVDRIVRLEPEPARLFALLTARRASAWPVETLRPTGVSDPDAAIDALVRAELADHLVPWDRRAELLPRRALAESCRALGLPCSGRRADLVARLRGKTRWRAGRWLRLRHAALLRRLEQWALLRKHPDRSVLVVERLGHVRWPDYALTGGTGLFRDRRALRGWEHLLEEPEPERILDGVRQGLHRAPGNLDLARRLAERLVECGRARERAGQLEDARRIYLAVEEHLDASLAVRVARTLEGEGRHEDALEQLLGARSSASPSDRLAIARAGRRIAAKLRRAWPPDAPPRCPRSRALRLSGAEAEGPRPVYRVGDEVVPVERAVVGWLAAHGRSALHAEGALWTTLFALLFAEAYFLPVSGALPVRFLAGPLDLGTPAFRARREDMVAGVLAAVRAGEAPDRVRAADAKLRGTRLAGATWALAEGETLATVAEGLGGAALAEVLEHLLARGWRSARGLPDLVVLPGPAVAIEGAHPSRLGPDLVLAEVKGPGDTVRDEQAAWFDRLLRAGTPIELWEVQRVDGSIGADPALMQADPGVRP